MRSARAFCGIVSLLVGCQTPAPPQRRSVEAAWSTGAGAAGETTSPVPSSPATDDTAIAQVNGVPVPRSAMLDLLLEGHGAELLEHHVVVTAAKARARAKEILVTQGDLDAEYERSLLALLGPNAVGDSKDLRLKAAQAVLDDMLVSRNISRAEYRLVMERNAYLRKLAEREIPLTEAQVREHFNRLHGERVHVRHIQLASRTDLDQVLRLRKSGADFGELALRYSAHRPGAEKYGELPPFTRDDPSIPQLLRETAFTLPVGGESDPILAEGWYHVIRVERREPADAVTLEAARPQVEKSLRERQSEAAMQQWHARLLSESEIEIADPKLRSLFFQKHADHRSARR